MGSDCGVDYGDVCCRKFWYLRVVENHQFELCCRIFLKNCGKKLLVCDKFSKRYGQE